MGYRPIRVVNCELRETEKQKDVCDLDSSRSSSGAGGDSDAPETGCHHISGRPVQHYGSFYLRMGAVAFGIGSMIYSGLEFGQYFELEQNTKCHNIMLALTPATRMAFIFIQMYFIFLNNEVSERWVAHSIYRYICMYKLLHNSRDLNFDGLFNWFGVCFSFAKMSQNLLPFIVKS